jgi:ParE-like toxin of type II ParDE toxin-antitoxin system
MADQLGMRAVGAAVAALATDPLPGDGFHAREYHRLRVGEYRIVYVVEGDLVTVSRVDRAPA